MNTGSKILNKIFANRIQQHVDHDHSKDAKMVQRLQINKCNTAHRQNQGQNHINNVATQGEMPTSNSLLTLLNFVGKM
jgi:hypothetical protein